MADQPKEINKKEIFTITIRDKKGGVQEYHNVSGYHVMEQGFFYITYFSKDDKEEKNLVERTRKSVYLALSDIERIDTTKLVRVIGKRDVFDYKQQGSPV